MSISDNEIPATADQLRSVAEQEAVRCGTDPRQIQNRTKVNKPVNRTHLDGRPHAAASLLTGQPVNLVDYAQRLS